MAARAIVFDVMGTLFDLAPLRARLASVGAPELALEAWFERVLHSATSLTLAGQFRPFPELAASALRTTLAQLDLDPARADDVLPSLGELPPYPDAADGFEALAEAGVPAYTLTNGSEENTRRLLASAGLLERVTETYTTADVEAYKPHPAPYRHAAERIGLPPAQITLIAAHGWDVVGALAAGLDGVWIDRLERRWPFPGPQPRTASGLPDAVAAALA